MQSKAKTRNRLSFWLLLVLALVMIGLLGFLMYGVVFQNRLPFWVGVDGFSFGSTDTPPKTLWDVLELLIMPTVLATGGFLLSLAQKEMELTRTEELAKLEHSRQEERNQEAALETYLDRLSTLMLDKKLYEPDTGSPVPEIARARTRAVLHRLNGKRKGLVMRFLKEAGLINRKQPAVLLTGADLREVKLRNAGLGQSNLARANLANACLERAILNETNLTRANLSEADLRSAQLCSALLGRANLSKADFRKANLRKAELIRADLRGADLRKATLENTKLNGADLRETDLRGTKFGETDLSGAKLDGARYDTQTVWPEGFDASKAGLRFSRKATTR